MTYRKVSAWTLALLLPCGSALAQHSMHSSHGHGHAGPDVGHVSGGVGGGLGWSRSSSRYGGGFGYYGSLVYFPPLFAVGPGGGFPMLGTMIVPPPLWPMAGAESDPLRTGGPVSGCRPDPRSRRGPTRRGPPGWSRSATASSARGTPNGPPSVSSRR